MLKNPASRSSLSNPHVLIGSFCVAGAFLALLGLGLYPGAIALAQGPKQNQKDIGAPQVVPMLGPVSIDQDLRTLPYIPPSTEKEERRLTRYPPSQIQSHGKTDPMRAVRQSTQAAAAMPTPIATFAGMNSTQSGCSCLPPDTDGDVGPNHYIQAVNSSIKIFDKTGTALNGTNGTTYNSFFSMLGAATPCGNNQNDGDGIVFYDHLADRWVVSDFAFPAFPGVSFYQCIGVSKTSDPVAGGWWLYALQVDPANPTYLGDYPKFGLWPDAYYLTVNLFSNNTTFNGVRVYALPRSAMINGTGAPNPGAVAFNVSPANLGDQYSLLPATFRTGSPPPAGQPEWFMDINSSAVAGTVETQVFVRRFHVDFATPANSTFGVGAGHTPDGTITVNGFVDAFTSTTLLVPQTGTTAQLDTLGDKLMTPLVYQNLGGTESLWVSHTVNNNQNGTGPTAIRWYQFNVTGNTIPASPMQQQTFNNGADGLWRWMPSIAVDAQGNMAIGYSVSSSTTKPAIKYAGRLASDPSNSLAQGEALLIQGAGHQTHSAGRWGDYSMMSIDPTDNLTFWHTNEYYSATSSTSWNTRIGKFQFPSPLQLVSVVSRMTHGSITTPPFFDITLPLPVGTMPRGIECRSSSSLGAGNYTLVFTFSNNLTSVGTATVTGHDPSTGTGMVSSTAIGPNASHNLAANQCAVNLTNVSNAQYITVTLNSVVDTAGNNVNVVSPQFGVLIGDTSGDGFVNSADISQTKSQSGQSVDSSTFREDVNTDGFLNSTDISLVKSKSGTALP
jgi:hypothetical protein